MKTKILILLTVALCAGCSHSKEDAEIESVSQKIDALSQAQLLISSNQSVILDQLTWQSTNLSDHFDSVAYYYHTNTIGFMLFQQQEIEDTVNTETRRVSVIMFTNFMGFQADTVDALTQIKLSEPDIEENAKRTKMESDVEQLQSDIDLIKVRLGIGY